MRQTVSSAAVLVAINSLFQIVAFSLLGYFYLELLPGWLGLDTDEHRRDVWEIAKIGADLPRGAPARRLPHATDR